MMADTQRAAGPLGEPLPAAAQLAASGVPSGKVLWRLAAFIKPDFGRLVLVLVLALLSGMAAAAGPYLIGRAINNYIPAGDARGLLTTLLLLGLIFGVGFIVQMLQLYLLGVVAQRTLQRLRLALMDKLNELDIGFFDRHSAGDLISRVSGDLNKIASLFGQRLMEALGTILYLVVIMLAMLALDWRLALASFTVLPLIFWSTLYLSRQTLATSLQSRAMLGALTSAIQEELAGIRTTQAFNRVRVNQARFRATNAANRGASVAAITWANASAPVTSVLSALSLAIVLGFGAYLTIHELSTVGAVVAFILYVQQFGYPVQQAATLYNETQGIIAATARIYEILDAPVAIRDAPDAVDLGPVQGNIEFQEVTFGYLPGPPTIHNVNFTVPAGRTLAVVGASGAGKSTLVNLLTRFYDVRSGRITVDGRDVREVTQASLRRDMAIILQQSTIFSGTVASNIRYGRLAATQEEVEAAAHLVNAHDFIMRLPQGYETRIGPRGLALSQGQRQLIVFARAVIRGPKLLILDEATSTLDRETERLVQDALTRVLANRTSLVIAHRLSTIRNADRIVVMDQGRVAELGTHEQLMAAGGLYANLVAQQTGGILHARVEGARLRAIALFAELEDQLLVALAKRLSVERYGAGEEVVRQGEFGDALYVISHGQAEVLVTDSRGTRRINVLNEGEYFGEMALLTGQPRSATVRTTVPTELYSLAQTDFASLLEQEPAVRQAISQTVSGRRTALATAFAFTGPPARGWLELPSGERHVLGDTTRIGRSTKNDLIIKGEGVSRNHAHIRRIDDRFVLSDLGSVNGVWVNGEQILGPYELADGDGIELGNGVLRFRSRCPAVATTL